MEFVRKSLITLSLRQDLALVLLLMIIITVMILPLPTYLMDALIVLNLSLTILILMVSIYLHKAEDFSIFPSILLLATTFRLAISISTTRLILSQADAGDIIRTFGVFVTQGSVVVGLVIFIIITTVQFVVVTKGAERVAEVAARFTLDAMPGRQMSIDAELRNGDIDQQEAIRKRQELEKENKFFGAMDGAMKFVKGDAIAGIIIIIVNLAGGFGIGTISMGMSAGEAANVYSRLTIGDGLVSQIPALLLAICAGMVITRVTTKEQSDLGTDIVTQLAGSSKTLIIAGIILALLGLVPGFPLAFFLFAALVFVGGGLLVRRRELNKHNDKLQFIENSDDMAVEQAASDVRSSDNLEEEVSVKPNDVADISVGAELRKIIDLRKFITLRRDVLNNFEENMGVLLPEFGYKEKPGLNPTEFEINIENVPVFKAIMKENNIIALCDKEALELLNIPFSPLDDAWPIRGGNWVNEKFAKKLDEAKINILGHTETLVNIAGWFIKRNAHQIIGFEQVQQILQKLQHEHPQLAAEVAKKIDASQLLEIIRRLIEEAVPIYSRRLLFEGLLSAINKNNDTASIVEHIRYVLRRQICRSLSDENNNIACYIIEPDLEKRLKQSIRADKGTLQLDAKTSQSLLEQVGRIPNSEYLGVAPAVIITSGEVRQYLRNFLKNHNLEIKIIAFQEVANEFHMRPVGTIALVNSLPGEKKTQPGLEDHKG